MIKLLIGLSLVAFFGFLGYFFSKKYRKRKEFFWQMLQFNERFLAEISYAKRPLAKFLTAYPYKGEFALLLETFFQDLQKDSVGGRPVFAVGKAELPFLTADELTFVQDYFMTLGKGDTNAQKGYFGGAKTQVQGYKEKSEKDAKKYGDLYVKLGILVGLGALILIV